MSGPINQDIVRAITEVINNEGGTPGNNIHSWRCEYPDKYLSDGPCDCVEQIAELIMECLERLVVEMKAKENEEEVPENDVPFVAIANGEAAPWEHLPNDCPICGEKNLPLQQSEPPLLQFISHCGGTWVRGPMVRP